METITLTTLSEQALRETLRQEVTLAVEPLLKAHSQHQQEEQDLFLSHKQACEFLHLAPSTLYNLVSQRAVPYCKRAGRLYYEKKDLIEWLYKSKQKAYTPPSTSRSYC